MGKRKLTFEYIKNFVNENSNCELESLDYQGVDSPLNFRCWCGNPFTTTFYQFEKLNKKQCNDCGNKNKNKNRKLTIEYVREFLKKERFELLSDIYVDSLTKLKMKCPNGHICEISFGNFQSGTRCRICSGKKIWTNEELDFINKNFEVMNINEISKKLNRSPSAIKNKIKTPSKEIRHRKSFHIEMEQINPNIKILEDYINSSTKIQCRCLIDNHIWNAKPNDLLNGHGCPKCKSVNNGLRFLHTDDYFKERMSNVNPNILIIGGYTGTHNKIKCKCLIDNCEWDATPLHLLKGHGCPACNASKGEKVINLYLTKNNIIFIPQKKYLDCKYKKSLPFDFYLPDYNVLIEYQGLQHYESVDFAGKGQEWAIANLKHIQNKDNIKKKYCYKNNIILFEIKYDNFDNINEILDNYLKEVRLSGGSYEFYSG